MKTPESPLWTTVSDVKSENIPGPSSESLLSLPVEMRELIALIQQEDQTLLISDEHLTSLHDALNTNAIDFDAIKKIWKDEGELEEKMVALKPLIIDFLKLDNSTSVIKATDAREVITFLREN